MQRLRAFIIFSPSLKKTDSDAESEAASSDDERNDKGEGDDNDDGGELRSVILPGVDSPSLRPY
jgi:hypothetical protein